MRPRVALRWIDDGSNDESNHVVVVLSVVSRIVEVAVRHSRNDAHPHQQLGDDRRVICLGTRSR